MNPVIYLRLKESEIFNCLTPEQIKLLAGHAKFSSVKKGKFIYNKGELSSNMYLLVKGAVKLGAKCSHDGEYLKDFLVDGDIFGENIFTTRSKRQEFAEAVTDTSYLELEGTVIKELLSSNYHFANVLIREAVSRVEKLDERLTQYKMFNSRERIVAFLTQLGNTFYAHNKVSDGFFTHNLSHLDIAEITDTSRQTVARVMSSLKEEGLIAFAMRRPRRLNVDALLQSVPA